MPSSVCHWPQEEAEGEANPLLEASTITTASTHVPEEGEVGGWVSQL